MRPRRGTIGNLRCPGLSPGGKAWLGPPRRGPITPANAAFALRAAGAMKAGFRRHFP